MAPKKRPWFRFYVEAVHDRKLRRQKPETRWLFVACLAAARQSPEPGVLLVAEGDPMTDDDLVDFAGMTRRQVECGMAALRVAGVVAFDAEAGAYFVPHWNDRQYESDDVAARSRKHRASNNDATLHRRSMQRSWNGDNGSDATPPENREQKTDTEPVSSEDNSRQLAPAKPPPAAAPQRPQTWIEVLDPASPAAVQRRAEDVFDKAGSLATSRLLPSETRKLRPMVAEALAAGYTEDDLAQAIASSPFRTPNAVMGELRSAQRRHPTSVGNRGLDAVGRFMDEGA